MEDTEKIKNTLQNAKNIGLFVADNPDNDTIGAFLALFFSLKNIGKKPFLINQEPLKKINFFLQKSTKEKIVFSFLGDPLEITYEKAPGQTNIYLTPRNNPVSLENFSFRKIQTKEDPLTIENINFDLLITIGVPNYSQIEKNFTGNPDALYQCDIINIDNNLANQNYGDINIVEDNFCLSQTMACLIYRLGQDFLNKKVGDSLIFGLANSPKNSRSKKNIITYAWLLKNKAEFGLAMDNKNSELSYKIKLLGKTIENLDKTALQEHSFYFSFLDKNNFSKASAKDLIFITEKMKNFFHLPSFLLVWEGQKQENIKGLFFSNDYLLIDKFKKTFTGSFKETGGLFDLKTNDLNQAKKTILSLLP